MIRRKHHEGLVRHDPVKVMAGNSQAVAQDSIVGLVGDDQFVRAPRRHPGHHRIAQGIKAHDAEEVEIGKLSRTGKEMHVGLDEAGQDTCALRIYHTGRRVFQAGDLRVAANGKNFPARHGNRLSAGPQLVHGEDGGIFDDEVGRHDK